MVPANQVDRDVLATIATSHRREEADRTEEPGAR
jgi:hypothetical protein